MEEIINSILYGKLVVDIPESLTLKQQLEIIRALVANQSAATRVKIPKDIHPWVHMLFLEIKNSNNV